MVPRNLPGLNALRQTTRHSRPKLVAPLRTSHFFSRLTIGVVVASRVHCHKNFAHAHRTFLFTVPRLERAVVGLHALHDVRAVVIFRSDGSELRQAGMPPGLLLAPNHVPRIIQRKRIAILLIAPRTPTVPHPFFDDDLCSFCFCFCLTFYE